MALTDQELAIWLQDQCSRIEAEQSCPSKKILKGRLIELHAQTFTSPKFSKSSIRQFVNKRGFKGPGHQNKDNLSDQKMDAADNHEKDTQNDRKQDVPSDQMDNTCLATPSFQLEILPKIDGHQSSESFPTTSAPLTSSSPLAISRKLNEFMQFYDSQYAVDFEDKSFRRLDKQQLEEALISEVEDLERDQLAQESVHFIQEAKYVDQQEYWSLIGRFTSSFISSKGKEKMNKVYQDTNIPCSVFICGLQGSGKSHTVTCMLENYLLNGWTGRSGRAQCSAMVFYRNFETSGSGIRPCELAFMGCSDPKLPGQPVAERIVVFAAPSNLTRLREVYSKLPNVIVEPLKFRSTHLSAEKMLCLMSVEESSQRPLYIGTVTRVLRELAAQESGDFSYARFKERLKEEKLLGSQKKPLQQRLSLLEEFIDMEGPGADLGPEMGTLAIIDLSCPFVERSLACALFRISMNIYLESNKSPGKVLVFDEAHQYLKDDTTSKVLTESVLSAVRLQRHHGVRVLISTQEPVTAPQIIDLSTAVFIHRFTSPAWLHMLSKHIIIEADDQSKANVFKAIQNLATGEALIFCPSASLQNLEGKSTNTQFLSVQVRRKMTWDAGKSIFCSSVQS